jgi:C-terminal processing protease CtpA/Prc
VTFDYAGKRIFFAPNAGFAEEDPFDRAGLWLNQGDAGLRVEDVVPGSPAAQVGIQVGDEIVAVDGKSAAELGLSAVRELLKRSPVGTRVGVTLQSGGEKRELTLVLRDLL